MNSDIRLQTTFPDHPKTIKLRRRTGAEGVLSLINLWIWTAKNKPSGQLSSLDSEDIEIASKWDGEPEAFYKTLIDLRLLDKDEHDMCSVHNWAKHNAYACHADARSAKAKKAAEARWKNKDARGCPEHTEALPVARESIAPSPDPSPSPDPLPNTPDPTGSEGNGKPPPCPQTAIRNAYHEELPMCPRIRDWTPTRQNYLRSRWLSEPERQSVEWWVNFFKYISKSNFLTGKTDGTNGKPPFIANLEWIVRPSNFTKILEGNYHREANS